MTDAVDTLLFAFFGDGNELALDTLATTNPSLAEWLERRITVLRREPLAATLLPRRNADKITWYGLAHSPRDRRELVQVAQSFVGGTYGTVRIDRPLDSSDPVDAAVLAFAPSAFTVDVLRGEQTEVRRAFDLFFELQGVRPHRQVSVSRPLGRLLRAFEMAVLAGSAELSANVLAEIEAAGQLSAQNIIFLRVRCLAGLRDFRGIMDMPELATILAIRRPVRVTAALFDAMYATELAEFETGFDAAAALGHFQAQVLPRYPALFRSRQGIQTSSAIKSYALYEATAYPEAEQLRSQFLNAPDLLPIERSYVDAIAHLVSSRLERTPSLSDAVGFAREGNFDAALELARDLPPTMERGELLVRCAIEIDSLDAMTVAQRALDDLNEADRGRITSSRLYSAALERIDRVLGGGGGGRMSPSTWLGWFELVISSSTFGNALDVAERSVVEWTSEALTPADSRSISQLLNHDVSSGSLRCIKDALPNLLQFIERVSDPVQHRTLLDDLSTLLLLDDDPSVADVAVLLNLLGSLFEVGTTAQRRLQLSEDLAALFARIDAPAYLDLAIEQLDMVLTFAASDFAPRDVLLSTLLGALQRWRRRVTRDQWLIVQDLAGEVGAAEVVNQLMPIISVDEEKEPAPNRDALRGKTVAIYTLTESAATRARDFLLRNFEGVSVEVSSDHVATDRLASLARSADVFVVATRSAKHPATAFIEAHRPPNKPPAYATGKGSVSLLRAILATL